MTTQYNNLLPGTVIIANPSSPRLDGQYYIALIKERREVENGVEYDIDIDGSFGEVTPPYIIDVIGISKSSQALAAGLNEIELQQKGLISPEINTDDQSYVSPQDWAHTMVDNMDDGNNNLTEPIAHRTRELLLFWRSIIDRLPMEDTLKLSQLMDKGNTSLLDVVLLDLHSGHHLVRQAFHGEGLAEVADEIK